ncbi:hypothetical protein PC123_g27264 [Phytophthora cactorum]|nr:hypothetical protein PC123_g27264 [Phytophthora cactorum]
MIQLLSILQPVAELKLVCQAETPTQVEVLMKLFKIHLNDLNPEKPVQHYLATEKNPRWIDPSELLPLAKSTRLLLRDALDERYFRRYYDDSRMIESSFVFEMQQRLHPIYKCPRLSLNAVVVLVCRQHGLGTREACTKRGGVNEKIRDTLLTLMKTIAEPIDAAETPPTPITYFNELETLFAPPPSRPQVIILDRMQRRNAEELDRWNDDPIECEQIPKGTHRRHTLSCFTYPLDLDMDMTIGDFADEILANFISNSSLCEEENDTT